MKIIAGLGNPGKKYKATRHNAGFLAVDFILQNDDYLKTSGPYQNFKSELFTSDFNGQKVIFIKPQTFMNRSGQAILQICDFYKLNFSRDLLVIHDEIDLPLGTVKMARDSSAAGHNGIKNIIENLGTQNFHRLRIGVETRISKEELPTDAFILQDFGNNELDQLTSHIFPKVLMKVKQFLVES